MRAPRSKSPMGLASIELWLRLSMADGAVAAGRALGIVCLSGSRGRG